MSYQAMPRNQYTRTKTGIVIGSAYVHKASCQVDEDMQKVQNSLLKETDHSLAKFVIGYILLVCFAGALFGIYLYFGKQFSLL